MLSSEVRNYGLKGNCFNLNSVSNLGFLLWIHSFVCGISNVYSVTVLRLILIRKQLVYEHYV
jgi:hypothetical protein